MSQRATPGARTCSPVVASWLKQLGYDAYVLEGGVRADLVVPETPRAALPDIPEISPAELKRLAGRCAVLHLGASMAFRKRHVPGSRWTIRPRIAAEARAVEGMLVLVAERGIAEIAAKDLHEAGKKDVRRLAGGIDAWTSAGYATESSPGMPPDAQCIDYLFFVHDRHAGNREAMKQYLAWETGLMAQLSAEDRALFKIG